MDEIRKTPTTTGLNELEKIFNEYKNRLEYAEREANEIIDVAEQKAVSILAEKRNEAQLIADNLKQEAQQESGQQLPFLRLCLRLPRIVASRLHRDDHAPFHFIHATLLHTNCVHPPAE